MGILLAFDSKVRFKRYEEFMLVCLVSASGLIFNIGATYLLFYFGGISAVIAKTVAAIPTFLWNYILRRNFIFKKRD
jgi:putative flippase GtrA